MKNEEIGLIPTRTSDCRPESAARSAFNLQLAEDCEVARSDAGKMMTEEQEKQLFKAEEANALKQSVAAC